MQKTLVIRGSGGLSNRLQAVLAGIAHCLLSGRALCVDWRDGIYSDDFSNVFPCWFTLRGLDTAPLPSVNSFALGEIFPPFWIDWLADAVAVEYLFANDHLSADNMSRTSIDFSRIEYPEQVIVGWAADLQAALTLAAPLRRMLCTRHKAADFANFTDTALLGWLAHEYLELAPHLQQRVQTFAAQHFTGPRTIGIHIRHTDLQSPLEEMLTCLRQTVREDDSIFVTTDNQYVQRAVLRLFPRAVCTNKLFPAGGEALHCFVPSLSNVEKGESALVDMYLLARCDHIIHYGQSSFARIPLLLAALPPENIHSV